MEVFVLETRCNALSTEKQVSKVTFQETQGMKVH